MTCGGVGSPISACPVPIAARVANTFSCRPATTVRCPKAATSSPAPAQRASLILGRLFMENNDPKPAADLIRKTTKIYPYEAGGVGTSIAEFLTGKAKLARPIVTAADRVPRSQRQGHEHHSAE